MSSPPILAMLLLHQETPPPLLLLLLLAVPIPLACGFFRARAQAVGIHRGQREFVVSSTSRASAVGSGKQNGGVRS